MEEDLGGEPGGLDLWKVRHELASRIAALTRDLESKESDSRIVAKRALDGFYIGTFYAGAERRRERHFEAALADFEICALTRPKTPMPVYEKARTHAASGERKRALAALKNAIDLGFADAARLAEDPEWTALRDSPEYAVLRDALGASR